MDSSEFINKTLTQQDLPDVQDIQFRGHPKRYFRFLLLTSIGPLLFIVPAFLVLFLLGIKMWAWLAFGAWLALVAFILLEETKGFAIRGYALREHDITYQKGWLFYTKATIPFNRIQHCEIGQGPMAQLFELAELRIFTAGGAVSDLSIGGLPPDEAHRLREYIAKVSSSYD